MEDTTSPADAFDAFWEASGYSRFNIKEFAAAQEEYSGKEKVSAILEYPAEPKKLPLPRTLPNKLARKRRSDRTFGTESLSARELGKILSSFYSFNGEEHRAYPSAGGLYGVDIFCVANNVEGFSGKLLYYNPDLHALSTIGDAPSWNELSPNVNVQAEGTPQCILVFVLFPGRLTGKYLERGGRFGLIEVGAAVQQLALQLAATRQLKGVAAGGMVDAYWLQTLQLDKAEACIALGYLCGK